MEGESVIGDVALPAPRQPHRNVDEDGGDEGLQVAADEGDEATDLEERRRGGGGDGEREEGLFGAISYQLSAFSLCFQRSASGADS
jgi:hypothetical protein